MKLLRIYRIGILLFALCLTTACKKYLDKKPDQSLAVIASLRDLQSLLDNLSLKQTAGADETSADDYFLSYTSFLALTEQQRNMHVWEKENLFIPVGALKDGWAQVFDNIYVANTVLSHMDVVERTTVNTPQYDDIQGQALFLRAFSFYRAASIWCLAYDEQTASQDMGLPLRLSPDFNERSVRSSLKQTYDQLILDAETAAAVLPTTTIHVHRPSKAAAYALLAKIYLSMRNYEKAEYYADQCLAIKSTLLDFNSLNVNAAFPIPLFNTEVLHESYLYGNSINALGISRGARISPELLALYEANDLRKSVFFASDGFGNFTFKGSYTGNSVLFCGLALDEVFLIKAESAIRNDHVPSALLAINNLLSKRFRTGTFNPLTTTDNNILLTAVLNERRKELLMRGVRWLDIKRLNKEGFNIDLKRSLNGAEYILNANDLRFALPLPDDIIERSGMLQNPR